MDDVQALMEKIRKNILAEAEQKLADEAFQHLRNCLHKGRMKDADGQACVAGENANCMEMYLKFCDNRVDKAKYVSDGDGISCLCGSCTADMAIGKTTAELLRIKPSDVLKRVQRSGEGVEKQALLAVEALHKAVENYWIAKHGNGALHKLNRKPRFVAVGRGTSYMQYSH
ncbi:iron-sulfur cluster assembly scaffold protein [Desulfopila aestuarii]|uniref:NifU homolog involved in Fe-S cluster formation n=1 Tax=Desulfopila aestuarii DSM 18488 TaxID=1121416 RepID=A0A1M7Y7K7_9BACT|nr:iron-sulfur cluster assembly scaffold protein [Desulfopila aestuarii]SHO48590.1 NifU homolog involved in Fe-S cluster formation [Desulfopila aestuarii DSM 18488]